MTGTITNLADCAGFKLRQDLNNKLSGAQSTTTTGNFNGHVNGTINVTAQPYNAKCDGVTDDTAAIQAASNAAFAAAESLLIPGICVVRQLNWTNHQNGQIHVYGTGSASGGGAMRSALLCRETTYDDKVCVDMTDTQRWSISNLWIGSQGGDSNSGTCTSTGTCPPRISLLFSESVFAAGVNSQVADLDNVMIENRAGGDYALYDYGGEILHATHYYLSNGNVAAAVFSAANLAGITSPFRGTLAAAPVSMTQVNLNQGIIDVGTSGWGVILEAGPYSIGSISFDGAYVNSSGPGFMELVGTATSGNFEDITVNNIRQEPQGATPGVFLKMTGGANSLHNITMLGDQWSSTAVNGNNQTPVQFISANGPAVDGGVISFRPGDGQTTMPPTIVDCSAGGAVGLLIMDEDFFGGGPTYNNCPGATEIYQGVLTTKQASAPAVAPGAGHCQTFTVAGTNAGTCKIQTMCGTSTTPVTLADNVGGGC